MNPPESSGSVNQRFRTYDFTTSDAFLLGSQKSEGPSTKVAFRGTNKLLLNLYFWEPGAPYMDDAEGSLQILPRKEIGTNP
jgi:hypothetical protein